MGDDSRRLHFGLWYDFRNPPQWRQSPDRLYREILDQIVWGENNGFDDVWLSEHHFIEEVDAHAHYIRGNHAPEEQSWRRGDIRSGRTEAVTRNMLGRIVRDVAAATGSPEEYVWVYLCDLPAFHIIEYGQVMCPPGEEDARFATLPNKIKEGLQAAT